MAEPAAHTEESRVKDYLDSLKRELVGAKTKAGYVLDELGQKIADGYVKDVTDEIARVTGEKPKSGPVPTPPHS
jgi:hypothetical protein